MADFLTISGTVVKVTDFNRTADDVGGKRQRTLSGQRRGNVIYRARNWQGTAYLANTTELNTFQTLADDSTSRACLGDGMPSGGLNCHVELTGVDYVRNRGAAWYQATFVLREVAP